MLRVLIIDDEEYFGHILKGHLQKQKFDNFEPSVEWVASGEEAYVLTATEPFDLFIIDYNLGSGLNGLETMETLLAKHPNADAILLTGLNEPNVGLQAYELGAYRYLEKTLSTKELEWIIQSLAEKRATQAQRDWLHILTSVDEQMQQATSLQSVADAMTQGGQKLGFRRSRFYLIHEYEKDNAIIEGFSQNSHLDNKAFIKLNEPLQDAPYPKRILDSSDISFLNGHELGTGKMYSSLTEMGLIPPLNEWVGIPLQSSSHTKGILILDNDQDTTPIPLWQKELIQLFARNALVAFERVVQQETQQLENQAFEIARNVTQQIGDAREPNSFEKLLTSIQSEFSLITTQADNFVVALKDDSNTFNWIHYRLQILRGEPRPPEWHLLDERSMTHHLLRRNEALFLPTDVDNYRKKHDIALLKSGPARSWMGVPLKIGENSPFGTVVLAQYDDRTPYTRNQIEMFKEVVQQLSGLIYTAWMHEQQQELVQRLTMAREASQRFMILAEIREEWLWHTMLTVCTAGYGFGFDRAILLLRENGSPMLKGHLGIGHFDKDRAKEDWEEDVELGMDFDLYLEQLQSGRLRTTEIQKFLEQETWTVEAEGLFTQLLEPDSKPQEVSRKECKAKLPSKFIDVFDETDYVLIPLKAADDVIGLIVLDNIWETDPHQRDAIRHIDSLTDQAALIYTNLRASRTQTELIEESHPLLAAAPQKQVKTTLHDICRKIRDKMGADMVAIYPLKQDGTEYFYDLENAAWLGMVNPSPESNYQANSFTAEVMRGDTIPIGDIPNYKREYNGNPLRKHQMIAQQGIQALIASRIKSLSNTYSSGILYINYKKPQIFTANDIRLAKSFAQLASMVFRLHELGDVEAEKIARERELEILDEILRESLQYNIFEEQHEPERQPRLINERLVELLLPKIHQTLSLKNISLMLGLREWKRSSTDDSESIEVRYQYALDEKGAVNVEYAVEPLRGISGLAIETGETQYIPDVKNNNRYYLRRQSTRSELDVPIKLGAKVLGVLNIESSYPNAFRDAHINMMERIASALALTIDNISRQKSIRNILNAAKTVTDPSDLTQTLEAVVNTLKETMPELSLMTLWYRTTEDINIIRKGFSFGLRYAERDRKTIHLDENVQLRSLIGRLEPLWAEDVSQESLLDTEFIKYEEVVSTAVLPLNAPGGENIGIMFFSYRKHHDFSPEDRVLFGILAEIVAAELRDMLHLQEVEQARQQVATALAVTEAVGAQLDYQETVEHIFGTLSDSFPESKFCILLYDEEKDTVSFLPGSERYYPIDHPKFNWQRSIPLDEMGIVHHDIRQSIEKKRKVINRVRDVHEDPDYLNLVSHTRSSLSVTLYDPEKGVVGILVLEHPEPNAFRQEDVSIVTGAAKGIRLAIERSRQNEDLQFKNTIFGATAWLAPIVHDINRETGRIRNRVAWLQDEPNLSSEGKESLVEIDQYTEQLAQLVTDLAPGADELHILELNNELQHWIDQAVTERGAGTEIKYELDKSAKGVQVRAKALKQAINHLTRNALESMAWEPDQQLAVYTRFLSERGRLEIWITDVGAGIDIKDQSKLFKQPHSTKEGEKRGLGLLAVRAAVEEMNGSVRLHNSIPGKGSTFVISLPIYEQDNNENLEN